MTTTFFPVADRQTVAAPRRRPTLRLALAAVVTAALAGAQAPPQAAATLSRTGVPAAGRQETIVTVAAFGYYALTVSSAQGTALQLVDRMAGPGRVAGVPGTEDGRLDLFLDRGEYKVVALGHEKASGTATLQVHPFSELHAPPPLLVELKPVDETLQDFQQASYWLQVDQTRIVAIEAAGRNLADLRLWRDGTWLHEAVPERERIEPKRGHPMQVCRLTARLEAGLYLVTAYGGPGQLWSEDASEHPLYVRYGIPRLPQAGRQRLTVGPMGYDRFLAPADTTYFRIELAEARPAQLQVGQANPDRPFLNAGFQAEITKKSLPPAAELHVGKTPGHDRIVTVSAEAGQPYILQQFEDSRTFQFQRSGAYWLSTVHSGHAADSVDATAIVTRWTGSASDREAFLDSVVDIDGTSGWTRRCNLLDTMTVFLKVGATGRYEIDARGVEATFRIEPFFIFRPPNYETPKAKPSGSTWDLDAGFYVLTALPETRGIIDITVRPYGVLTQALELLGKETGKVPAQTPLRAGALFPNVELDSDAFYVAYLNDQPGVRSGVVLRPLPLDLTEALPVTQRPGEAVKAPFTAAERGTLRARDEAGHLVPVSVDGGAPVPEAAVEPGEHSFSVANTGKETILYSVALEPQRLQAATPLPPVPAATLAALPKLPTLTAAAPAFLDMTSSASTTFLVRADSPALYHLESTGLLATEGTVRTRTVLALDRKEGNGVGRNFLIQQYLREGDYELTVRPRGASAGHLGVQLAKTSVVDGGLLAFSVPARISLPAGQGVAYRFTIPSRGAYHLRTLGLGHSFRCRLEDADGWPIEPPNINADITRTFEAGDYRLVLLPEDVMTRRVTVLQRIPEPLHFAGHGPHHLPLDAVVEHVWEQAPGDGPQLPDVWEFALPATARVDVALSPEMNARLTPAGGGGADATAELTQGRGWSGELQAGSYRLSVVCARNNNQVGYRVSVRPEPLVAGLNREVVAPDAIALAVGRAGLVELSSFGSDDVRAVLVDSRGRTLAADDDRPDDWNFNVATHLEPGRYALRVLPVGTRQATCTVSMRAPGEVEDPPLAIPGDREIETGHAAHVVPLWVPPGVGLLVASVRSAESVGCVLEARVGDEWRPLATRVGRDLRLEVPLGEPASAGGSDAWRLRIWSVDQRGLPARLVAAAVTPVAVAEPALAAGVDLAPVAGSDPPVGAVRVRLDRPGTFTLSTAQLRAAAQPGRAAAASDGEPVAAPGTSLWLVGDVPPGARAGVRGSRMVATTGDHVTLRVPAGEPVVCDLAGDGIRTVLALVTSVSGQPGVRIVDRAQPGASGPRPVTMAVGRHGAVAVAVGARQAAVAIWQAEPSVDPLEVRLQEFSYGGHQPQPVGFGTVGGSVAGVDSLVYLLPAGAKRLQLALGEGVVAVLCNDAGVESVHWAGGPAFTESLDTTAGRLVVLRAGGDAETFSINVLPSSSAEAALVLGTERPFESVETTGGVLRLTVPRLGATGDPYTVHVRGASGATLVANDGLVRHGAEIPAGGSGGNLLVRHGPGRVLCWLDRRGGLAEAIWGLIGDLTATTIEPPAVLALRGKAMLFRIALGHPALLHLRTATPVATRLVRPEGEPEIELHPNGCMLDAYLPSGAAELGVRAVAGVELAGIAELTATAITAVDEGLGPSLLLPPGETRGFSFTVTREGPVGVGVRADSDAVTATLLDNGGRPLGSGVVVMAKLAPGSYVLTLHTPAWSRPAKVRPAVVGIRPPDTGPPEEVVRTYLEQATGRSEPPPQFQPERRPVSPPEETDEESDDAPDSPGGAR